jgi:hypothetical protein
MNSKFSQCNAGQSTIGFAVRPFLFPTPVCRLAAFAVERDNFPRRLRLGTGHILIEKIYSWMAGRIPDGAGMRIGSRAEPAFSFAWIIF